MFSPDDVPIAPIPLSDMPSGAVDAHAHVLGPYRHFPLSADRDYDAPEALVEDYRAHREGLGLQRSVIVQPSIYGSDNRATLAAVEKLGTQTARAVVMLEPSVTDAELDYLDALGTVGIRYLTLQHGAPSVDGAEGVAKRIASRGWHLQLWMRPEEWRPRLDKLMKLPTPLVFDHLAQLAPASPTLEEDINALQKSLDTGSVWVKLIGYRQSHREGIYDDIALIIERLLASHPERLVWGLDWPHTNLPQRAPDDGILLQSLRTAMPNDATFARVLVDNPTELYQW